jgi:hypothetical protein
MKTDALFKILRKTMRAINVSHEKTTIRLRIRGLHCKSAHITVKPGAVPPVACDIQQGTVCDEAG